MLTTSTWWTGNQRNVNSDDFGGGARHAIEGTLADGRHHRAHRRAHRHPHRRLPRRVRPRARSPGRSPSSSTSCRASRRSSPLCSSTPIWVTAFGFSRSGFAAAARPRAADDPGRRPLDRGDAQARARTSCARPRSRSACPSGRTIVKIVLRTAIAGIVTGVMLGIARVMGETAPLLILAPYTKNFQRDLFNGNFPTLPMMINQDRGDFALATAAERMWGAALTLILLVMILNLIGRVIAHCGAGQEVRESDTEHGQANRRQRPQRLLRLLQGHRGHLDDGRAPLRHGLHRPVRLRQVDLPAHPQPDARGDPRRSRRGQGHARRREPLRQLDRPRDRAPHGRHGLPAAEPLPDDVDLRQRRGGPAAQRRQEQEDPRRHRREVAQGRQPLERGQGPPEQARRRPLRRPAAAAVHRPGHRRASRRCC